MEMEKVNIYQKLFKIQTEVDKIVKNAAGFNFKYADGNAVLEKVRPLMIAEKLLCVPFLTTNITEQIFYKDKNNNEKRDFIFQSIGGFKWIDSESAEILDIPWVFSGNNDDASQAQGNALTYNERYFLLKFFKIQTPNDDPDAKKTFNNSVPKPTATATTNTQKKEYSKEFKAEGDKCEKCGSPVSEKTSAKGNKYWKCTKCDNGGFNMRNVDGVDEEIPF